MLVVQILAAFKITKIHIVRLLSESVDGGNFLFELLTKKPQGHNSFAKVVHLTKKLTDTTCFSTLYQSVLFKECDESSYRLGCQTIAIYDHWHSLMTAVK